MKVDGRSTSKHSREKLPVGTVRVRKDGNHRVRMIKVHCGLPKSTQWMNFARWWWIKNRGPIPEAMRVLHKDGNVLNDEPSNLILGTAGDQIFLSHKNNPAMSEDNYRKLREATAEHNRLRGRIKRLTSWNECRWYPVDHVERVIHNCPVKSRYMVWPAIGIDVGVAMNGGGCDSEALGWKGRPFLEALILAALAEGELPGDRLLREVERMRAERDEPPLRSKGPLFSATCVLAKAGMIVSRRMGRLPGRYSLTPAAIAGRGPWTPVVPVWGAELHQERYGLYRKIDPEMGELKRIAATESFKLLAGAFGGAA